jgi:hypothetical protein
LLYAAFHTDVRESRERRTRNRHPSTEPVEAEVVELAERRQKRA